jgi:hypothetical protein
MNLRLTIADLSHSAVSPPSSGAIGPACTARTLLASALVAVAAIVPAGAYAQSYSDVQRAVPPPVPIIQRQSIDPRAVPGPVIYVTDAAGELSTINLGTFAVRRIGSEGTLLTDIAFSPNGQLYGVSFTTLYRINRTTGQATFIGNLGISDANALVFDAKGNAYTAGAADEELYSINLTTGRVRPIGSMAPFNSAGDLTFYNGFLILSGCSGPSQCGTRPDTLVELNPNTGKPLSSVPLNVANLYGLTSTAKNVLFGFAGTSLYQLLPNQANIYKRAVLLKNFSQNGLAQIYGTAYDGNFQN